ncbi:hypothetical protein [Sphingomonas montana]|uniref:hypothetical protein n=1 Tax=Sphingomonas montana TaxID=1843236 RepID=UPI0019D13194|nr:hypothetical protein [Sphingomonas montana]
MLHPSPLLLLPFLAGCAATGAVEGPVRLGQTAHVGGPRVRADRVVEDSRCPVDTQCVRAGRLIVRATVSDGSWSRQVDLMLGQPVPIADGALTLIAAVPDRRRNRRAIGTASYRFSFDFQGGL